MAILVGVLVQAVPIMDVGNPQLTPAMDAFDVDYWFPHESITEIQAGAEGVISDLPIPVVPRDLNTNIVPTWLDDYYHRIHVLPLAIDTGVLVGDTTYQVEIWNSYLIQKTMIGLTENNNDGISFDPSIITPLDYKPLESTVHNVTIGIYGPLKIDAEFLFDFTSEEPILTITGLRTVPFIFKPNWDSNIIERLEWKTTILRSYDGTEQRIARRVNPRREFSLEVLSGSGGRSSIIENLMYGGGAKLMAVPIWTEESEITSALSVNDININCDIDYRSFASDGWAVLLTDENTYGLVSIASVGDDTLVLNEGVKSNWALGTKIYPIIITHTEPSIDGSRYTDTVAGYPFTFTVSPLEGVNPIPVVDALVTYQGDEVIEYQPNWADGLSMSFSHDAEKIDYQVGAILWDIKTKEADVIRQYRWTLPNLSSVYDFRAFLGRRHGQQKPVYVPSWNSDFRVAQVGDLTSVSTSIEIYNDEYTTYLLGTELQDLTIITASNGLFHKRVINTTDLGDGTLRLTFDSAFGVDIPIGDVTMICKLLLFRLSSDIVQLEWLTDSVATVTLNMRSVPE